MRRVFSVPSASPRETPFSAYSVLHGGTIPFMRA
jgi:hypothetical protein